MFPQNNSRPHAPNFVTPKPLISSTAYRSRQHSCQCKSKNRIPAAPTATRPSRSGRESGATASRRFRSFSVMNASTDLPPVPDETNPIRSDTYSKHSHSITSATRSAKPSASFARSRTSIFPKAQSVRGSQSTDRSPHMRVCPPPGNDSSSHRMSFDHLRSCISRFISFKSTGRNCNSCSNPRHTNTWQRCGVILRASTFASRTISF